MTTPRRMLLCLALVLGGGFSSPVWADPPKLVELRTQKVGQTTYFHLVLEAPADLRLPSQDARFRWWNEWEFARLPRLVPQDDKTWAVYARMLDDREAFGPPAPDKKLPPGFEVRPEKLDPPKGQVPPPPPPLKEPIPPPVKRLPDPPLNKEEEAQMKELKEKFARDKTYNDAEMKQWEQWYREQSHESRTREYANEMKKSGQKVVPPDVNPPKKEPLPGPEFRGPKAEASALFQQPGVMPPIGVEHLEFFGKVQDKAGKARLLLLYPTEVLPAEAKGKKTAAELLRQQAKWVEVELTLDFSKAKPVVLPAVKRVRDAFPNNDDLLGTWAMCQGRFFAMLEEQTPEFGFYGFARETTSIKYAVPVQQAFRSRRDIFFPGKDNKPGVEGDFFNRQLYEITTGAAAITESLALNRLRNPNFRNKEEQRTVEIRKVQGITIGEHPWVKMMAGKKPSPEPLARMVPHDNYYVHFKNIAKFLETGDLFDQWGTTLSRAMEISSRDYQVKEKLEQQLCLKSTKLARIFGPAVVKSIAFTGSDPYVREGSDVTVIFHVANKVLFLTAVEPHIKQALDNLGAKELAKQSYRDVTIESLVSPLREVSMHRAVFGDFIVYSNSPAGIRRVIDTHQGKHKSLAEALDFQYMRTVFRLEDPLEDGFVFFSDAFIRNLVGPALRIKERRRLEALTSLSMATNGALFTAWETGHMPANHNQLLAYTGLKTEQLFSPDGDAIFWNADQKVAQSAFYNTLTFATPLIEIPIEKVTPSEQQEYEQFRREYMGLWRQYFDPIGIRIKLGEPAKNGEPAGSTVRWETYILPLVQTSQYNELRRLAGDGTIKLKPGMFNAKTIVQFVSHVSPKANERREIGNVLKGLSPDIPGLNWMGNWFTIRLDDSPVYGKLAERMILREIDRASVKDYDEDARLFFQIPLTLGVEIRNPIVFAGVLATVKTAVNDALPGAIDWAPLKKPYKGTSIVQVKARSDGALGAFGGRKGDPFAPSLYYALVDGAWYVSMRQECIQDEVDAALARKKVKDNGGKVDVNTSLYVSPEAAVHTKEFLRFYLEWETHRRAVANAALLHPLYRGKIISPSDDGATIQSAAMKYFGFIPVSPDYSPYMYDRKTDEVVNKRHGTLRMPQLHDTIDPNAPLAQLLEQFRTLRADLSFREDGLQSVVTFRRK